MTEYVEIIRDFLRNNLTDPNTDRESNWIYDDYPRQDLTSISYPRISVIELDEIGQPLGLNGTTFWVTFIFQIDVWVKEDTGYTIDSVYYGDIALCRKIARDVTNTFREDWLDLVYNNHFLTLKQRGKSKPSYNPEKKMWKISLTYELKSEV